MSGKKFVEKTKAITVKSGSSARDVLQASILDAMRHNEKRVVNSLDFEEAKSFEEMIAGFESKFREQARSSIKNLKAKVSGQTIGTHLITRVFTYEMEHDEIQKFLDLWKEGTPVSEWLKRRGVIACSHAATYESNIHIGSLTYKKTVSALTVALLYSE